MASARSGSSNAFTRTLCLTKSNFMMSLRATRRLMMKELELNWANSVRLTSPLFSS